MVGHGAAKKAFVRETSPCSRNGNCKLSECFSFKEKHLDKKPAIEKAIANTMQPMVAVTTKKKSKAPQPMRLTISKKTSVKLAVWPAE